MTEQINDQISAFIDDELSADESALLVRRFERDSEARARAMRYTLIGSALRGELLEPHPSVLRQRVAAALSGTVPTAAKRRAGAGRLNRSVVGFGIAAAVALVAIGSLRLSNGTAPESVAPLTANLAAPAAIREVAGAPSYVVPRDVTERRVAMPPIRLTNYLMHHGVYASSLARTTVNSNVVGATTDAAPETAEESVGAAAAKSIAVDSAELE